MKSKTPGIVSRLAVNVATLCVHTGLCVYGQQQCSVVENVCCCTSQSDDIAGNPSALLQNPRGQSHCMLGTCEGKKSLFSCSVSSRISDTVTEWLLSVCCTDLNVLFYPIELFPTFPIKPVKISQWVGLNSLNSAVDHLCRQRVM